MEVVSPAEAGLDYYALRSEGVRYSDRILSWCAQRRRIQLLHSSISRLQQSRVPPCNQMHRRTHNLCTKTRINPMLTNRLHLPRPPSPEPTNSSPMKRSIRLLRER